MQQVTVSYNFDAFMKACNSVPQDSPFRVLYDMLLARQTQKSPTKATLSKQRNNLRTTLLSVNLVDTNTSYEAIFVSLIFVNCNSTKVVVFSCGLGVWYRENHKKQPIASSPTLKPNLQSFIFAQALWLLVASISKYGTSLSCAAHLDFHSLSTKPVKVK
jgi:hypothetical protein